MQFPLANWYPGVHARQWDAEVLPLLFVDGVVLGHDVHEVAPSTAEYVLYGHCTHILFPSS